MFKNLLLLFQFKFMSHEPSENKEFSEKKPLNFGLQIKGAPFQ